MTWKPIETLPKGTHKTYLLANAKGQVAPCVRGVIYVSPDDSAWDWHYGEAATHWRELPPPPSEGEK